MQREITLGTLEIGIMEFMSPKAPKPNPSLE